VKNGRTSTTVLKAAGGDLSAASTGPALDNSLTARLDASLLDDANRLGLLQMCVDGLGEGVVVADRQMRFLVFNPAAQRIIGRGATSRPPEDWQQEYGLFHSDETTPLTASELPLMRVLNDQPCDDYEVFVRNEERPEGLLITCTGRPLRDSEGRVQGAIVSFRDVSEQRRMRRVLDKFHTAAEQSGASIVIVDGQGRIDYVNPAALRTFQYAMAEVLEQPIFAVNPLSVTELLRVWTYAQQHGEYHGSAVLYRKDGTAVHVTGSMTPIRDHRENVMSWLISFTDTGEQQRAEAALKQTADELARSNAELQQFAQIVSHDLQEPLRVVNGFLSLLKRRHGQTLEADAVRLIDFAIESAGGMQALIRDLLEYSRVDFEGRLGEICEAEAAFQTAVANLGQSIEETDADVRAGRLPRVPIELVALSRVFQNLVGNAIKFRRAGERPRVKVRAHRTGDTWTFTVEDNGIGVDPRQRERIFTVFQRLHPRSDYPGTGIGLSIAKKIVERNGGRIWVESNPGGGSLFRFTLPATGERQ